MTVVNLYPYVQNMHNFNVVDVKLSLKFFKIYLTGRERHELPFTDSLLKCPQQKGLGQTKGRNHKLNPGLQQNDRNPTTQAITRCLYVCDLAETRMRLLNPGTLLQGCGHLICCFNQQTKSPTPKICYQKCQGIPFLLVYYRLTQKANS